MKRTPKGANRTAAKAKAIKPARAAKTTKAAKSVKTAKAGQSAAARRVRSARSTETASRTKPGGRAVRPAPTALLERERRTLPDDERLGQSAEETPNPTGEWPDAYAAEPPAPPPDHEPDPGDIPPAPPEVQPDPIGELAERTRSRWEADEAPDDAEAGDHGVSDEPEITPVFDFDDAPPDRDD